MYFDMHINYYAYLQACTSKYVVNCLFSTITSLLDDDDIFDVHKALLPAAAQWKEIGFGFRLKSKLLEDSDKAPSSCLLKVVSHWLGEEYNVERFGKPTWKKVVEVVGDPAAGNDPALACQIAKEHLGTYNTAACTYM